MFERLSKSITFAKIIDYRSKSEIVFNQEWIDAIINKNQKHALLIISTDNTLRLIPTLGFKSIKFHIELDSILDNLLEKILALFSKLSIKPLFNSGVCFTDSICYLEFFVDFIFDKDKLNGLINSLEEFAGTKNIVMEVIELKQ